MPSREEFELELNNQIARARRQGRPHVEINSGELHRVLGGYPGGTDHRMPICCDIMHSRMGEADKVIHQPEKGKGAALTIRYLLSQ